MQRREHAPDDSRPLAERVETVALRPMPALPSAHMMHFAARLREARESAGLSIQQLADVTSLDALQLAGYEHMIGINEVRLNDIIRIAHACGRTLTIGDAQSALLPWDYEPPPFS